MGTVLPDEVSQKVQWHEAASREVRQPVAERVQQIIFAFPRIPHHPAMSDDSGFFLGTIPEYVADIKKAWALAWPLTLVCAS